MIRTLALAGLVAVAFAVPAQAATAQAICDGRPIGLRCIPGDPFRPCGPIVVCP